MKIVYGFTLFAFFACLTLFGMEKEKKNPKQSIEAVMQDVGALATLKTSLAHIKAQDIRGAEIVTTRLDLTTQPKKENYAKNQLGTLENMFTTNKNGQLKIDFHKWEEKTNTDETKQLKKENQELKTSNKKLEKEKAKPKRETFNLVNFSAGSSSPVEPGQFQPSLVALYPKTTIFASLATGAVLGIVTSRNWQAISRGFSHALALSCFNSNQ